MIRGDLLKVYLSLHQAGHTNAKGRGDGTKNAGNYVELEGGPV